VRLAELCAKGEIEVLDAPVSGGRPAAEERRLTTMVGGPQVEALKLGSAAGAALSLLTMVPPHYVPHLSGVETLDMELFDQAMRALMT
jgi:hypothetical protein